MLDSSFGGRASKIPLCHPLHTARSTPRLLPGETMQGRAVARGRQRDRNQSLQGMQHAGSDAPQLPAPFEGMFYAAGHQCSRPMKVPMDGEHMRGKNSRLAW
jgi:hypothetical protein